MFYHFDVDRWIFQALPPILRKDSIYAFLRVFLFPVKQLQEALWAYISAVNTRLKYNSTIASLEHFLNSLFFFEYNAIFITENEIDDQVFLSFFTESEDPVYMSFSNESPSTPIVLSSLAPGNVHGSFVVHVPAALSEANRATVADWVNYYKFAGTEFTIEVYE